MRLQEARSKRNSFFDAEAYAHTVRLIEKKISVKVAVEVKVDFAEEAQLHPPARVGAPGRAGPCRGRKRVVGRDSQTQRAFWAS